MHCVITLALLVLALYARAQEETSSLTKTGPIDFSRRHCLLRPQTGPCKAAFPKWFYNPATKQCEPFTYGGCGGNNNRFNTKADCEAKCLPTTNICRLKPDPGPCEAAIPRWFFNPRTGKCQQFTYGGCEGNKNNFATRLECQEACRKDCVFVNCFEDPCQITKCEAFPRATCVPNLCTGCDADFLVNGRLVDCGKKPVHCVAEEGRCRNPAALAESDAVGAVFFPPCCDGLTCCACGPPVVTEDFKPSPFGRCRKRCICPIG